MTQVSSLARAMDVGLKGLASLITSATRVASTTGTGKKTGDATIKDYLTREESMARDNALLESNDSSAVNSSFTEGVKQQNYVFVSNIATLNYDRAERSYERVSELIDSGRADQVDFYGANGSTLTKSAEQYLFWLQAHMQEIEAGSAG